MKKILFLLSLVILFTACDKERPIKNCNTYPEPKDPNLDTSLDWSKVPDKLNASFASIDVRYPKSEIPDLKQSCTHKIVGWKGERLSAQILMWAPIDVKQIELEFSDFKSDKSSLSNDIAQARFVRYVITDEYANGCGDRKPEDFPAFLSADMLDNSECFDMEARTSRPVWITVEIPGDAHEGTYSGTIELFAKGHESKKFSLEVEVLNHTLPEPAQWKIHLDLWQHPSAVARVHNLKVWSNEHFEKMKPVMKMLANMGQKVITANVNKDPWNNQCFDAYEDMIIWTKHKDGTWSYDYNIFDKWINFMMNEIGITKMINCYSLIPWNNEVHYIDESKGNTLVNVKADPGSQVFVEIWKPFLIDFTRHLKEKGWFGITNIAMDERSPEEMTAALKLLKEVSPEFGISLADNQKSYKRYPYIKDMCVSAGSMVDSEDKKARRKKNLNTTYYVYCGNEFPNTFTFSDPAEGTYLSWYAIAADYDGFLRWAYNSWVENPITDSRFRKWPAGDTYSVYPDAGGSIRYERTLEGVQDFEKIHIIRKLLAEKGEIEKLTKLNTAIAKLNTVERTDFWNSDLNTAKEILNEVSR